jgi:MFS family permease
MVGPFAAGLVAEALSWHWVFLGVLVLVAVSTALMLPSLRGRDRTRADRLPASSADARRAAEAAVVAVSVVALSSLGEFEPTTAWLLVPVFLLIIGVALRNLVPPGTYRIRPGLPATVALCGVAGGVFFGTEVYLPLLLHDRYGLPTWLSGLTLTAGAIAWALASAVQGRLDDRLDPGTALRAGAVLLAGGALTEWATVVLHLPPAAAVIGWFAAGAGMGTLYPRISTLVLALSAPGEQGFNTAAKSITDAVGGSASLAIAGLLFTLLEFVGPFAFTSLLAVVVILIGLQVSATRPKPTQP